MIEDLRHPEIKEKVKPAIGLRMQDVIMRSETTNKKILKLREKIFKQNSPTEIEREERLIVLNAVTEELLGLSLPKVKEEAGKILFPYKTNGEKRQTLIMSSASSSSDSHKIENEILKARGHIIDIPGAIEGRDTRSAKTGDISLISTKSGLQMAKEKNGVEIINLTEETILELDGEELKGADFYYKADALLLLMLINPNSNVLVKLNNQLRNNPLIYPYSLDEETQSVLLWLARKSELSTIDVNANSPEVAVELTRKGYRYPKIEEALLIKNYDNPYVMQIEEWKLSQSAMEIGYHPDCVPGYVICENQTYEEMNTKSLTACMLLASRYGLQTGWIKPDRGTDGGGQGPIELGILEKDQQVIMEHLQKGELSKAVEFYKSILPNLKDAEKKFKYMWENGESWVIEAKTNFFNISFSYDGKERILTTTPSVHIIKGEPRQIGSMQLVDEVAWGGNLICSECTWKKLIQSIKGSPQLLAELSRAYKPMLKAMQGYVDAINSSDKYKNGQVRGGADLAICTLGGKFGQDLIIAIQDYNARANGCEAAHALYDHAREIYGENGEAVTRNITPKADFDTFIKVLPLAINEVNKNYKKNILPEQISLIAVSEGWGQIGIIGTDALEIMREVFLIEDELCRMNIVQ